MTLAENIQKVQARIAAAAEQAGRAPSEVTLVAATKVQTSETIGRPSPQASRSAGKIVPRNLPSTGKTVPMMGRRFTSSGTCRRISSSTWWARWI